ncbi:hypothetical protein [Rhodococcoides kyotonense]|nr:hypothetical protein [Rhodococcus kyotonensis]
MAQILHSRQADEPILDWLEVIAKAAALGQISDTDTASGLDRQDATT